MAFWACGLEWWPVNTRSCTGTGSLQHLTSQVAMLLMRCRRSKHLRPATAAEQSCAAGCSPPSPAGRPWQPGRAAPVQPRRARSPPNGHHLPAGCQVPGTGLQAG